MPGHPCPVCDYPNLSEPPRSEFGGGSFEICPSCGFQFGVDDDDEGISYETWRRRWEARGMPWMGLGISPPAHWKPVAKHVAPGGAALRRPGETSAQATTRDDAEIAAAAATSKPAAKSSAPAKKTGTAPAKAPKVPAKKAVAKKAPPKKSAKKKA